MSTLEDVVYDDDDDGDDDGIIDELYAPRTNVATT